MDAYQTLAVPRGFPDRPEQLITGSYCLHVRVIADKDSDDEPDKTARFLYSAVIQVEVGTDFVQLHLPAAGNCSYSVMITGNGTRVAFHNRTGLRPSTSHRCEISLHQP